MKTSNDKIVISDLLKKIDKKKILLDHPIQRKSGQFTPAQKSLLIDSLLREYIIPPIYIYKEDGKEYVIDGLQRLSIIKSFVDNEFALTSNLKPITYTEGDKTIELNLSKLKFKKLPEELQDTILGATLVYYKIEDCKEGEINEVFLRLNNGVPLNKPQKLHAALSTQMQAAIKELIELDFFTKTVGLTKATRIKSHDESMILQTLMLLNDNMDFSKKGMPAFLESYTYNQEDFDLIKNAVLELGEKLPEKSPNLKKSSIPMIIYALIKCPNEFKDIYFSEIMSFSKNYNEGTTYDDFKELCESGTISPSNVEKRVKYFLNFTTAEQVKEEPLKKAPTKKDSK